MVGPRAGVDPALETGDARFEAIPQGQRGRAVLFDSHDARLTLQHAELVREAQCAAVEAAPDPEGDGAPIGADGVALEFECPGGSVHAAATDRRILATGIDDPGDGPIRPGDEVE